MQREAMENAHMSVETVNALQYGREAMTHAHKDVRVDDIHDMIDEIADEVEHAKDIQDVLGARGGLPHDDVDDDELNAELEQLCLEDVHGDAGTSVRDGRLPDVPTNEPGWKTKKKGKQGDDDMKALEAWAT